MALQINFVLNEGTVYPAAYLKVDSFSGDKEKVVATVYIYKDQAAREAGVEPCYKTLHQLTLVNGASYEDMYKGLLEIYKDGVSV